MTYNKFLIVVDEDVDAKDISTVAWKVFNNIDAKRDLVIEEANFDNENCFGHRLGIDATKKIAKREGHTREWPNDIVMSDDIKEKGNKEME